MTPTPRRTFAVPFDDAVNLYHTDPEMFLPATVPGSPASRVAPTVAPVAGNADKAAEKASLRGAAKTNVTAMATLPFAPLTPSTCRLYTMPCVTLKLTQLAPGKPPVVQLSLLATRVRLLIAVPV
jgi:hypothetical protein